MYPDKKIISKLTGVDTVAFREIGSTNDIAKEMAKSRACDAKIIIAANQTGGHGRGDRSFFCYDGGLYMSLIVPDSRATLPPELITSGAAAAVCRAVRAATGAQVTIKWVNDLYLSGRKICGILALRADSAYIVGIGINVRPVHFPDDIRATAAALGSGCDLNILAADVAREVLSAMTESADSVIEYCRRNSFTLGKTVTYERNGVQYEGIAEKLFPDGSLGVTLQNGRIDIVSSGEISVKTKKSI